MLYNFKSPPAIRDLMLNGNTISFKLAYQPKSEFSFRGLDNTLLHFTHDGWRVALAGATRMQEENINSSSITVGSGGEGTREYFRFSRVYEFKPSKVELETQLTKYCEEHLISPKLELLPGAEITSSTWYIKSPTDPDGQLNPYPPLIEVPTAGINSHFGSATINPDGTLTVNLFRWSNPLLPDQEPSDYDVEVIYKLQTNFGEEIIGTSILEPCAGEEFQSELVKAIQNIRDLAYVGIIMKQIGFDPFDPWPRKKFRNTRLLNLPNEPYELISLIHPKMQNVINDYISSFSNQEITAKSRDEINTLISELDKMYPDRIRDLDTTAILDQKSNLYETYSNIYNPGSLTLSEKGAITIANIASRLRNNKNLKVKLSFVNTEDGRFLQDKIKAKKICKLLIKNGVSRTQIDVQYNKRDIIFSESADQVLLQFNDNNMKL